MIPFARMLEYGNEVLPPEFKGEYEIIQDSTMSARGESGYCSTPDGDIYVVGGVNASQAYLNDVQKYTASTETWSSLGTFPGGNRGGSAMAYDEVHGRIYTFAGASGVPAASNLKNDLYRYEISTSTWTLVTGSTGVPAGRVHSTMVAKDGFLYVFGNYPTLSTATGLYRYNTTSNAWSTRAVAPRAMAYGSYIALIDDYIYAIGVNGSTYYLMRYDITNNVWAELFSTTEVLGRMVRYGSELVIMGFDTGKVFVVNGNFSTLNHVLTIPSYAVDCNIFANVRSKYILSLQGKGANGLNSKVIKLT